MKKSSQRLKVLFDTSVILAGIHSPSGGSGKLLTWVKGKRIHGVITEIIVDEALRHNDKLSLSKQELYNSINTLFSAIAPAPPTSLVHSYTKLVHDHGDAHLLASAKELSVTHLVTLDKKHLLSLTTIVKEIRIVSPKEFIELLR